MAVRISQHEYAARLRRMRKLCEDGDSAVTNRNLGTVRGYDEGVLTRQEAAGFLSMTSQTLMNWASKRTVPAPSYFKNERGWHLYRKSDLEKFRGAWVHPYLRKENEWADLHKLLPS